MLENILAYNPDDRWTASQLFEYTSRKLIQIKTETA